MDSCVVTKKRLMSWMTSLPLHRRTRLRDSAGRGWILIRARIRGRSICSLNQLLQATIVSSFWIYLALCERDAVAAGHALNYLPSDGCHYSAIPFPHAWCEGLVARLRGDNTAARSAFTRAHAEVEGVVRQQPDYAEGLCALGMIDAALGSKKEAIQEGRRAGELSPVNKDSIQGAVLIQFLAVIYAWTGENKLALDQLEIGARIPA